MHKVDADIMINRKDDVYMYPNKLQKGSHVRVIAPSRSLALISEETREIANRIFAEFELSISFGKHVEEIDEFISSSVESRVADLHVAFSDSSVDGILTAIGGYNSNQLLNYIDFELIQNNPKVLCGYSDITILANAIYKMTSLVTYYGPYYSTFGMKLGNDYTKEYFQKCVIEESPFTISPSSEWSDDMWFLDQDKRTFIPNEGYHVFNLKEKVEGTLVGGNLGTFSLLFGTKYMPDLRGTIVLIEDDCEETKETFERHLVSLIQQPNFKDVKALLIGRFQKASKIEQEMLETILSSKPELKHIPIITNVDFGHTMPIVTLPIGGTMRITSVNKNIEIEILEH